MVEKPTIYASLISKQIPVFLIMKSHKHQVLLGNNGEKASKKGIDDYGMKENNKKLYSRNKT